MMPTTRIRWALGWGGLGVGDRWLRRCGFNLTPEFALMPEHPEKLIHISPVGQPMSN